jgi:hypothetical protein
MVNDNCCATFREIYRQYVSAYTLALLRPSDTELKVDLQKLEDQLQIIDLVISREQAKMQVINIILSPHNLQNNIKIAAI